MRTDDGVGVHAIRRSLDSGQLPHGVQAIEGGTLGLDLLPRIERLKHLLVIDAVDFGASPGALSRFANQGLLALPTGKSVHLLGFSDLLSALRLLGQAPSEVVLLGVQPESTDWGVTLSHHVAAVLDDLLAAALAEIHGCLQGAPAGMALCGDAYHS